MTVNHINASDPAHVHEAVVSWVEKVLDTQFTVCVTKAGRNQYHSPGGFGSVDWMGYQGAPEGGVAGEMDMPHWWTGSVCKTVNLPKVSFVRHGKLVHARAANRDFSKLEKNTSKC